MSEPPRVIAVPSDRLWLDPPFVARQLYTQITDVQIPSIGVHPLVGLSSVRWALGVTPGPATPATGIVAPWGDLDSNAGWTLSGGTPLWFDLTRYASLVTGQWYCFASGTGLVRVIEVIRQA